MSQDPQATAEARGLMACIRVTRDPVEQNRLWNRYYRLSDEVFPEAAALRKRYKGLKGEARQRFKSEYMELVRRLWLATDPDAAYDKPLAPGSEPESLSPKQVARGNALRRRHTPPPPRRRKKVPVHRWAIAAVGLIALAAGGFVGWQFVLRGGDATPAPPATETPAPVAEAPAEPVPDATSPVPAPPPPQARETGVTPPERPPLEVPVAEIEAELVEEIQPEFAPVPQSLRGRGDQVTAGATVYEDVYVIESDALYYVRIPGTGGVDSVSKADTAYTKSADAAGRAALLNLWKQNRDAIARAEAAREKEKVKRIAARRKAQEQQREAHRAALEEASWRAKEKDWLALVPEQRHSARLRAYSDWHAIQRDAETLEELYRNIARTYEYIGVNDSRMADLNKTYRRVARDLGPNYDVEDAFMIYGWGREEILRQLAEWEGEYYQMLDYLNEHYPVYEARVKEIERLDASLPEPVRVAEAAGSWESDPEGRPRVGISFGTGFIVAEGHVMTCAHVVGRRQAIRVTSSKGDTYDARVVASDPANDWCLLAVEGLAGAAIPMAAGTPNVGATIYCLGYPLGGIKDSNDPIVGSGNVAALQRIDGDDRFLQITAPINPGNSGGPVIDQHGRWVGIVSQKLSDLQSLQTSQSVAQGLNYAVKAAHILPLLNKSGGTVQLKRAGGSAGAAVSLEQITRQISPSIVKIEAD